MSDRDENTLNTDRHFLLKLSIEKYFKDNKYSKIHDICYLSSLLFKSFRNYIFLNVLIN